MKRSFVLGIHPSSRGFGWALFEGPLVPFDWGTVHVKGVKNSGALARFKKLLDQLEPAVLAIESFDYKDSQRSDRVRQLCRELIDLAEDRGIRVQVYSRSQIAKTFGKEDTGTRDEIASAVANRIAVLRSRLPKPRAPWEAEHPNLALFAAAACALTYLMGSRS